MRRVAKAKIARHDGMAGVDQSPRYDAFADATEPEPTPAEAMPPTPPKPAKKVGNPGHGDDHWLQVKAYWLECRSVKQPI
jgi:hypothetical protein